MIVGHQDHVHLIERWHGLHQRRCDEPRQYIPGWQSILERIDKHFFIPHADEETRIADKHHPDILKGSRIQHRIADFLNCASTGRFACLYLQDFGAKPPRISGNS